MASWCEVVMIIRRGVLAETIIKELDYMSMFVIVSVCSRQAYMSIIQSHLTSFL